MDKINPSDILKIFASMKNEFSAGMRTPTVVVPGDELDVTIPNSEEVVTPDMIPIGTAEEYRKQLKCIRNWSLSKLPLLLNEVFPCLRFMVENRLKNEK